MNFATLEREAARRLLIVMSAPSGAGKTTLCERLLAAHPDMAYSVSCTTRGPRGDEVNGRSYHFLSEARFEQYAREGRFLEQAMVHGHRYGTLRATVADALAEGRHVLLDIDVQGARQIRDWVRTAPPDDPIRQGFVDIFISPPSMEELKARLERRGEDAPDVIARRLKNAAAEMAEAGQYRYRIVNDDLERAFGELAAVVEKEIACSANPTS